MSLTTSTAPISAPAANKEPAFSIRNIAFALLAVIIGAAGVAKRDRLGDAMLDVSARLTQLEFLGLSMTFSEATIARTVRPDVFAHLSEKAKADIAGNAKALQEDEVLRLLNVGLLEKLCDFELGTGQMRQDFEADRRLRDSNLVRMEIDDALKTAVLREIKQREVETGARSDIGYPRLCYRMSLTDAGQNVRTALVYAFASGFAKGGK